MSGRTIDVETMQIGFAAKVFTNRLKKEISRNKSNSRIILTSK